MIFSTFIENDIVCLLLQYKNDGVFSRRGRKKYNNSENDCGGEKCKINSGKTK